MDIKNIILILLTFLLLSNCSIDEKKDTINKDNNITELTLWCRDIEAPAFVEMNNSILIGSGIRINVEIQAEPRSKFIQAVIAGGGPDLLVGAHDWTGELAKNGLISDITIIEDITSNFIENSINGFYYKKKLFGIPYCVEALILIYNKNLISNPPVTFEELVAVAKKLSDFSQGKYGFLYGIDNNFYNNYPFIASQGGYVFKNVDNSYDITDLGLDNEGAIAGANFINKLVDEGIVPIYTNNGTVEFKFKEGKAAMIIDGPWNIKSYRETVPGSSITGLPTLPGKPLKPFVGSRGIMINQSSIKKSKSIDFIINYFSTYKAQMIMYNNGLRPPARKDAANEVKRIDPEYSSIYKSIDNGDPMPNIKAMAIVFNYAAGMIDKFNSGEISVEESIKSACQSIRDEIMAKYDKLY